jgi:hypothetical protein
MLCGGCQAFGRSGGLPVPGTLSRQGEELKDINGKLYDYLQTLLWVGRNNYDNYDCGGDQVEGWEPENGKPEIESYRFGNGRLGNRRLRNYESDPEEENHKPEARSRKPGNGKLGNRKRRNGRSRKGKSSNREIGMRALDGCMEIVGLPDGNEMLLANNIDGEGVRRMVREAMVLKARKEKLVGRIGKDVALLEKRYVRYESSHRTLRTLQVFGGLVCTIVVVFCLVFFRLR